ncbi:oligosaccharide flippase family protein [Collinsella sp. AF02-46-1]|uniref:oligosaccharide flippase family protein n=1 Tax=Collinsella sp. AF02-46-1 TaxID=2292207 RepID=UPI00351A3557
MLAHILTPDLFGVIALVTMVTSFANMFSDAGFQKYLVQHEFKTDADLHDYANVAFWTNLAVSFLLWFLIGLFRDGLAALLGGYHNWLGDNRCEFSSSTYSGNQCSDGALSKGAFV